MTTHSPPSSQTEELSEQMQNDFLAWLEERDKLGPGPLAERIFYAGWLKGRRAAAPSVPVGEAPSLAARDVLAERRRQVEAEGWTPELDDDYEDGQLSVAAACYAMQGDTPNYGAPGDWPWNKEWWKPTTDRRNLVKAAALILADIERIDRAAATNKEKKNA